MNKSVIFLVNLILLAFCSNSRSVYFDAVIDNLIEMNQAAGKDNNDLSILVSQISSALEETHEKFVGFNDGQKGRSSSGVNLLEGYIKKLEQDQLNAKTRVNKAEEANKLIDVERKKYAEDLQKTKKELLEQKAQIRKAIEELQTNGAEAEAKIVVIKTLKDIITDELLSPSGGKSFIQLEKFNDKLRELKTLLKKSSNMYTPLVTKLLELAETKGFSDQKILDEIMGVLKKLEQNLVEFRKHQEKEGKEDIENLKTQAREKITQVKTIGKMLVEANSHHEENETIIKDSNNDLEVLAKDITRKQQELSDWNKLTTSDKLLGESEEHVNEALKVKLHETVAALNK